MPQLDFSTFSSQLFWLFVSFLSLYGVLRVFILPKITHSVESRKKTLQYSLQQATKCRDTAEKIEQQIDSMYKEAREKARILYKNQSQLIVQQNTLLKEKAFKEWDKNWYKNEQLIFLQEQEFLLNSKSDIAVITQVLLKKLTGKNYSLESIYKEMQS